MAQFNCLLCFIQAWCTKASVWSTVNFRVTDIFNRRKFSLLLDSINRNFMRFYLDCSTSDKHAEVNIC